VTYLATSLKLAKFSVTERTAGWHIEKTGHSGESGLPKPWRDRRVKRDRYSVCFSRPVCLRDGRNRLNTWPVCPAFSWRLVSSTFMVYVYINHERKRTPTYFSNTISNAMKCKVTNVKWWSLFTIQWSHKVKI